MEIEPDECVLTGRFVAPNNSVSVRVSGTPYFYRIIGGQADRMTDADRAQWEAEARSAFSPAEVAIQTDSGTVAAFEKPRRPSKPESE